MLTWTNKASIASHLASNIAMLDRERCYCNDAATQVNVASLSDSLGCWASHAEYPNPCTISEV